MATEVDGNGNVVFEIEAREGDNPIITYRVQRLDDAD